MQILVVLFLCLMIGGPAAAADPVPDDIIYDKVRVALANDNNVNGGAIEVKVSQGVVELGGTVRQEKQKNRAEKVTRRVKGVQKVVNNIRVASI